MPLAQVVLVDLPRMLDEIAHAAITGEPDMRLLATCTDLQAASRWIGGRPTTLVLTSAATTSPRALEDFAVRHAAARALSLAPDGCSAAVIELVPRTVPAGALATAADLVGLLRREAEGSAS
jgi:hypothetical protein